MHVEGSSGSGDEIRYTRYEGFSLQEKYDWMQTGRGPDAAEQVREALGELAGSMAESDVVLRGALEPLGMEWEGAAASALGAVGAQAAAWSLGSSDAAQAAGMGMTASGAGFAQARNSVQPPVAVSGPSTGELFGQVFTGPFGGLDDVVARYEAEAAKGHDADRALYAYESMLREANNGMGPIPAPPQIATQDADLDPTAPRRDRTEPSSDRPLLPPPSEAFGPSEPAPFAPADPPGDEAPTPPTVPGPIPDPPRAEPGPPPWRGEQPPLQPQPPVVPGPPTYPAPPTEPAPPTDPGPPGRIDRPEAPGLTPTGNPPAPVAPAPPSGGGPGPTSGGTGASGGVAAPGGGFGGIAGPGTAPGLPGGPGRLTGTGIPNGIGSGPVGPGAAGRPGAVGGVAMGGLGAPGGNAVDAPEDVEHSNRYAAPSDEFFGLDDLPSVAPAVFGDEIPGRRP